MAVLSPAEDLRDSAPNLYFRAKYIDTQIKCFFSMPAKGIVFSRYTTNSNVCFRNLQISVRGFILKINGNTNSDKKKLDNLKGTLSSQMRHRMDLRAIHSCYFLFI